MGRRNNFTRQNKWWQRPLQVGVFTAILTGLVFGFMLRSCDKYEEKIDILNSLNSELSYNYEVLKEIQQIGIETVNQSEDNKINDDLFLSAIHNMSVDDKLSINNWSSLQLNISKFPEEYIDYKKAYEILNRIIRFSKIKRGELQGNDAEKAALQIYNVISLSSKDFINEFEDNFR